jgi:sugar phosphate isomerase/epimerase
MVDVGDGEIDFVPAYEARKEAGIQHFFVEHDAAAEPLVSIRRSFDAFNRMING